jgi:hypothetical protein
MEHEHVPAPSRLVRQPLADRWFQGRARLRAAWLSRLLVMRQWLLGATKAVSAIAIWALIVWLGISGLKASGLLPPSLHP